MLPTPGGEQVALWTGGTVVAAQYLDETRGEHGVAVLVPFALLDTEQPALRIDIGDSQCHGFADAQSGSVTDHQRGAILETGDVVEEGQHFLLAEHDGKFVEAAGAGEAVSYTHLTLPTIYSV